MNEDKVLNILKELVSGLIIEKDKGDLRHVEILEAIAAMGASYVSPYIATSDNEGELDRYQKEAEKFAVYKDGTYPFLALTEEAGEVSALAAKQIRKVGYLTDIDRKKLADELGDVLWNIASIASDFRLSLSEIAQANLKKLDERKNGGTLSALERTSNF